MALTKAEMAAALFTEIGLNKREAHDFVDEFFETIRAVLESGEEVRLSGFGNFGLRDKRERPGRNLRTGEVCTVTARRVVSFQATAKLKGRVGVRPHNKVRKSA